MKSESTSRNEIKQSYVGETKASVEVVHLRTNSNVHIEDTASNPAFSQHHHEKPENVGLY